MFEISQDKLKVWQGDLENSEQCWENVMLHWLDSGGTHDYPATWQGLCTLLNDLKLSKVAEDLMRAVIAAEHTLKSTL